ncbi:hypothetical protein COJ41_11935 [Bacillus thuringiensis]|uniref:hypothetical protein n=1 Tax=Bacillus thuringiensis TaxID=1428 RepID=UPI000BF338DC|nr:hypothetical protein [Bacillus thuringiensis]PEY63936.1 hypothetical protein CN352_15010 [Bacillus thuringiensis]PFM24292.1 hypothetical protein COJ41_11935 [Bacillus thuringiensis]PFU01716.1 hypothetical protein COK75_15610 [Bacillus thuringiensis]
MPVEQEKRTGRVIAFKDFRTEWRRLKRIYYITMYSYDKTLRTMNEENLQPDQQIIYRGEIIAHSPNEFITSLDKRYAKMLREALFVRLVSLSESFFGDLLLEISKVTLDPFKFQKDKTYKIGKLLSVYDIEQIHEEIVQEEIRRIVLSGISTLKKFFKNQMSIDLDGIGVNFREIEELYTRRNLLVHAGGYIDEQYIKNFNKDFTLGHRLEVSEEYFIASLSNMYSLISSLSEKLESLYDFPSLASNKNVIRESLIKAKFHSNKDIQKYINEDFTFGFKETETFRLGEILIEIVSVGSNGGIWKVRGDRTITGVYIGYLKMLKRKNYILDITVEDEIVKVINDREELDRIEERH